MPPVHASTQLFSPDKMEQGAPRQHPSDQPWLMLGMRPWQDGHLLWWELQRQLVRQLKWQLGCQQGLPLELQAQEWQRVLGKGKPL